MINYARKIALNLLCYVATASAYGAIPQNTAANFVPQSDYKRIEVTYQPQHDIVAKANYNFFATNDVFKARGNIEAQVSDKVQLDLGATVQVLNGQQEVIPKASLTYKLSDRSSARISYNEKDTRQYNNKMVKVAATFVF